MKLRKRFLLALAISFALHVVVIAGPGWHLLSLDELLNSEESQRLEARLLAPPKPAVAVAAARPVPKKRPAKPKPASPVGAPAETAPKPDEPAPTQAVLPSIPVEPTREVEVAEVDESAVEEDGPVSMPALQDEILLPRYVRIHYRVSYGNNGFVVGEAIQELRHDGRTYFVRSRAETTGLVRLFKRADIVNTSVGNIVGGWLQPQEFRVERNGKTESAIFDWTSRVVMLPNERQTALPEQTQDMMSMFCQLGLLSISGDIVSIPVLTTKVVERYDFKVLGEQTIQTPLGDKRTVHLLNQQPESKEATEVWLGLEDARLPIRIRHTDRRGDTFDQIVDRIEYEDPKGTP